MWQLHSCALCDWETTDGRRADAMVHLETEHDLRQFWLNGRAE